MKSSISLTCEVLSRFPAMCCFVKVRIFADVPLNSRVGTIGPRPEEFKPLGLGAFRLGVGESISSSSSGEWARLLTEAALGSMRGEESRAPDIKSSKTDMVRLSHAHLAFV